VKTRELCTVAALTAMGNAAPQLAWHAGAAITVGAEPAEVDEVRAIAAHYTGAEFQVSQLPLVLDHIRRELATVALLTALATKPLALGNHVRAALDAGASRSEVIEVIEQMAVYAGFPAALNGIAVARDVFDTRHD